MTEPVTLISGNMRCGSSLVMRMLGAAGLPLCYDQPESFEHSGYLRWMREREYFWLPRRGPVAVKWLDPILHGFPPVKHAEYRVVVLTRDARVQVRSHVRFLRAIGSLSRSKKPDFAAMTEAMRTDNAVLTSRWAQHLGNEDAICEMTFEDLVLRPQGEARRLTEFVHLPSERAVVMGEQVLRRAAGLAPRLLEVDFPSLQELWHG